MSKDYTPNIPDSLLEEQGDNEFGMHKFTHENFTLKSGVTIRMFDTDSDRNVSKLGPEYDVAVVEQQGDKGSAMTIYKNCLAVDRFGGMADFFEAKFRTPTEEKYESTLDGEKQDGSFVLLLCLDGQTEKAVILGGLRHPARKEVLTKDAGVHAEGEFNGINFQVNKDGEMTLTFKSKTDNKGEPQDKEAGGTFIKVDKTGQVDINTALEGDDETYIRMDKANKDVGLKAGQHIGLTAQKNVGLIAKANINMKASAELIAEAEGTATFKSGGAFDIDAGGKLGLKAPGGNFQFDGSLRVKASSIDLGAPVVNLGQGGSPALVLSTQFLGTGNLGAPVMSQAIGPFSSVVFVAS